MNKNLYKVNRAMNTARTAWITGASSGIGAELARLLAADGWQVAVSARSTERLAELAAEFPGRIHAYALDVTDEAACRACVERLCAELGTPDLAVLNAGDYRPMKASEFDVTLFRQLVEVNYLGVVQCLGALLPRLLAEARGEVMINASVAGYRGLPLAAPYGATKAALINMAESLRTELRDSGVAIRVINPGFVRTPLTDQNAFRMPALLTPQAAAHAIAQAIGGRGFEITFPKRFTYMLKLMRCLPYRLYFHWVGKMTGH